MLRLWPEKQSLFLFPENAWWTSGKAVRTLQSAGGTDLAQMNLMAEQLLAAPGVRRGVRPVLDVVVGGDAGRVLMLPWQSRLRNGDDQRRYAEVCFESEGVSGNGWIIVANYRHFGAPGLAVAVRREVLASLTEIAAGRALHLRSVLPLAVLAYWRHRPLKQGSDMLVLEDGKHLTALAYSDGQLFFVDIQPFGSNRSLTLTQLLRRCQTAVSSVKRLSYWMADAAPAEEAVLSTTWPGVPVRRLAQKVWI